MFYLVASCIALLLGPLFYRYFSSGSGLQKGLDGFIFVSLGGLVLIHILPELVEHGGLISLVFVALGLCGPTASEKLFHKYSDLTHNLTLFLGVGGLLIHTLTDGGAMVLAQQHGYSPLLALGVILHRLPVGIAIWWLLKPQIGTRWAWVVLISMMLLTGIGYFTSEQLLHSLSIENTVYLQSFVTGSILHVVLHQPHGEPNLDKQGKYEYQAGIGSILGVVLLILLLTLDVGHGHEGHTHEQSEFLQWLLVVSPALLLAYFASAIRYKLGLQPNTNKLGLQWLQRLIGPEAIIISLLLFGPGVMLLQIGGLLLIGGYLTYQQIQPATTWLHDPKSCWRFGFGCQVEQSAPWILLSLILANLIGRPMIPLDNPLLQVLLLLILFLPLRFCHLGGAVFALALGLSGWSPIAVLLVLLIAPISNLAQLALMSITQKITLFILISAIIGASTLVPQVWQQLLILPNSVNLAALLIVAILFAASLLRMGPRQFLAQLLLRREPHKHHPHSHQHSHVHQHQNK